MERDLEYENNNIGFDCQYPNEDSGDEENPKWKND